MAGMTELVDCPVCSGTKRVPVGDSQSWLRKWPNHPAYHKEDDTMDCLNCGGQTMSGKPTGKTPINKETGKGCVHVFLGVSRGNCYTVYTCKHCLYSYDIDSGD